MQKMCDSVYTCGKYIYKEDDQNVYSRETGRRRGCDPDGGGDVSGGEDGSEGEGIGFCTYGYPDRGRKGETCRRDGPVGGYIPLPIFP